MDTHEILSDNFTSDDLDCLVLPWECEKNSIGNFLSARHSNRWRENSLFGFNSTKSLINAGSDLKKVSDLEAKRLKTLLEAVKSSGFKEDTYSPITVTLLKKDGSYRYYVNGGNHRTAVLAYLGLSHIPAVSTRQVSYCEAESWLGVASGLFELQHAKEVFNRSFSGVGWQRSD